MGRLLLFDICDYVYVNFICIIFVVVYVGFDVVYCDSIVELKF